MKKLLLASAVAALSVSAAQAAPTVYGKAFLTLDVKDGNDYSPAKDSRSQLNSTGSRIGFKGSEALTANTDLVYQLEYGVDIDADSNKDSKGNDKGQFYSRDTYLGLANKQYGTLLAGRLTGIDDLVNYANVTKGGVVGGDNVLASFDGERFNNTFAYLSPSYNGVTFMGAYVMDEDKTIKFDDAFQLGAKYEQAALNAGLVYTQAGDFKATRVSGSYAVSPAVTVGGLYQLGDYDKKDNENAFTLSGKLKTATPWTAYGQVDVVSNVKGDGNHDKQRLVVGGQYGFNKNTTGHLYGAYLKDKYDNGNDANSYGVGAGIEYKF